MKKVDIRDLVFVAILEDKVGVVYPLTRDINDLPPLTEEEHSNEDKDGH